MNRLWLKFGASPEVIRRFRAAGERGATQHQSVHGVHQEVGEMATMRVSLSLKPGVLSPREGHHVFEPLGAARITAQPGRRESRRIEGRSTPKLTFRCFSQEHPRSTCSGGTAPGRKPPAAPTINLALLAVKSLLSFAQETGYLRLQRGRRSALDARAR